MNQHSVRVWLLWERAPARDIPNQRNPPNAIRAFGVDSDKSVIEKKNESISVNALQSRHLIKYLHTQSEDYCCISMVHCDILLSN